MSVAAVAVFSFFMAGWATAAPPKTASGRPEVTVRTKSVATVKAVIVNHFVSLGYMPTQTEGNTLVFQKEDGVGDKMLMGLLITGNASSSTRISFALLPSGQSVRVLASVTAIGQTDFGGTRTVELSGKGYRQMQTFLNTLQAAVDRSKKPQ